MRALLLVLTAALAGCGFKTEKLFSSYSRIEVREVGRSLYCNSPAEQAQAVLLDTPQAVLDWQAARGVTLAGGESLAQAPHAIVEMGTRPTGGYGLAVSRAAVLRGDLLILQATFVSPAPGSIRTQALSSPCALVRLPPGRYDGIEVQDPTGAVRATGGRPEARPLAAPAEPAPAAVPPPAVPSPPATDPAAPAS